jgi:hypothetical protein
MTSWTLAASSGWVENLKVPTRQGWTPCACQTLAMVSWLTPSSRASSRVDQWVIPSRAGGGLRVADKISARRARRTVCGLPGRGRSGSPSSPPRTYRRRQAIAIGRETPTRWAIWVLATPSAARSRMQARWASTAGSWADRAHRCSSARSSGVMSSAAAAGISHGHTSANEDLVIHFGVVAGCRRQRSSVR